MERGWIASSDDEVRAALEHPGLGVRPPGRHVPSSMEGSALGDVYRRLVRMNDGERHEELRARVDRLISEWDLTRIASIAREASANMVPLADIGAYVVATMIGIERPMEAMPSIRDFAGAIAAGASDAAIARGIAAAPSLLASLPAGIDADEAANLLGFLFQSYAATAALIENRTKGDGAPPVALTRRWAMRDLDLLGTPIQRGEAVIVLLTSPSFHFGAGRHACPGQFIARTIADSLLKSGA